MSAVVSLDDRGLDLVLGGGLRRVRRIDDTYATVLLVRGPAGSGKTLVGFHAALALSKAYPGPIAYACIEILPTELEAQLRSWRPDLAGLRVHHGERPRDPTDAGVPTVEASLIDLPEGPPSLGVGLEHLFARLTEAGRRPGVLVIDSLIDGYQIGSSAPREFVDSVCKLAAQWGIALVLLEECAAGTSSPWVFAADTVIELGLATEDVDASRPSPFERRLSIVKHRFGPSDIGPHRFTLDPGSPLRVLPRPSAWLEPWTADLPHGVGVPFDPRRNDGASKLIVPTSADEKDDEHRWVGLVVAAFGHLPRELLQTGYSLRPQDGNDPTTLVVSLSLPLGERSSRGNQHRIGVAHPYLSAHRFLREVLDELQRLAPVHRVIVTDLRVLRSFWSTDGLVRAVGSLCQLARRMGTPIVLVQSTANRMDVVETRPQQFRVSASPGQEVAWVADFADIAIEVYMGAQNHAPIGRVTDLHTGHVGTLDAQAPQK